MEEEKHSILWCALVQKDVFSPTKAIIIKTVINDRKQ